jgi:hypothetical protein
MNTLISTTQLNSCSGSTGLDGGEIVVGGSVEGGGAEREVRVKVVPEDPQGGMHFI